MDLLKTISLPACLALGTLCSIYQAHTDGRSYVSLQTRIIIIAMNSLRNFLLSGFFLSFSMNEVTWPNVSNSVFIDYSNAITLIWLALFIVLTVPLPLTYFYNENRAMRFTNPKNYTRKFSEAFFLTFLSLTGIVASFILTTLTAQFHTENIYSSQTFVDKLISFSASLLCIVLFALGGIFTIKPLFYNPIANFKKALNLEFNTGVFNESALSKEIENNNEELQYFLEKYSMTGNMIPRTERKRYEGLKKQRNLLLHRSNLTSQFVTKRAKLKNIIDRTKALITAIVQILLSTGFLIAVATIVLGIVLPEIRLTVENFIISTKLLDNYLDDHWKMCLELIVLSTLKFLIFLYFYRASTSEESPSQNENRRLKKALTKGLEIDEVQQSLIDNKKLKTAVINLSIACFLTVILLAFAPVGQVFINPDKCDLLVQSPHLLGNILPKECALTSFGYLYNIAILRVEFKALMFLMIIAYMIRSLVEVVSGVFYNRIEVNK